MGKKTSKTKSTSTPWQPAQPILLGAGNDITDTVHNNQGNLNSLETGLTGGVLPGLQGAITNSQHQLQPAMDYNNSVLGGHYLNSNPYIDQMVHQGEQDAGNAINSTFSQAGRTGSGNHAFDLARGVATAGNNIRNQDYQFERGQQATAAGMMPGLTSAQFAGYQPLLGATQLAGQLPYYGASALSGIGSLYNGYGTQTGTQPGGWGTALGGILGAGLGGWASGGFALPSDRRLKMNIKLVRRDPDGLGWYDWNWKSDPNGETVHGVIADEVKELRPWAYVPNFRDGYDGVNYATVGSRA